MMDYQQKIQDYYIQTLLSQGERLMTAFLRSGYKEEMVSAARSATHKALRLLTQPQTEPNTAGYQALEYQAHRLHLPCTYKTDLTHVARYMQLERTGAPRFFGAGLRTSGCDVYDPRHASDLEWALAKMQQGDSCERFFLFERRDLEMVEVSIHLLVLWLARNMPIESYRQTVDQAIFVRSEASYSGTISFQEAERLCNLAQHWYDKALSYQQQYMMLSPTTSTEKVSLTTERLPSEERQENRVVITSSLNT